MFQGTEWNPKQAILKGVIRKTECFKEAIALILEMHSIVHFSQIPGAKQTLMDELWEGLTPDDLSVMPTPKDVTIAWNIWHITRIEDMTMNMLVNGADQVFDMDWMKRLHTKFKDTGNAMTDDEIIAFSKSIDMEELKNYRMAVGNKSRKIIESLSPQDMKRKVEKRNIHRLLQEGCLLEHPDSIWLMDFWGKKDVAGLILMPLTRHQIGHINDSVNLKAKIKRMVSNKSTKEL